MNREPVTTAAELDTLDPAEVSEGYRDGYDGEDEPGGNRSKAYWHGHRNGQNDRLGISDEAQRELIRDVRRSGFSR